MGNITKRQAESSLKAVRKYFGVEADEQYPKLIKNYEGWYSTSAWAILWEGGPYEWPQFLGGGVNEELLYNLYPEFEPDFDKAVKAATTRKPLDLPAGVWYEPINGYSISLHKK